MPPGRMVTLDSPLFKCCQNLKTLGLADDSTAKALLRRAADQVKPIMARRGWAVPYLCEFYPRSPNLLGLNHNHGERIDVRLRSPSNKHSFLPYHNILGTLLHELVHIEVGPHNAAFYKLLNELNEECEKLMAAGNDGSSEVSSGAFEGGGTRLGDWSHTTVPRYLARDKALAAAQRRRRVGTIMARGGGRLGGSADIARLCDPREMALAAAERRIHDEVWCASARGEDGAPAEKDQTGSLEEVIDVDDDSVIVISDKDEEGHGGTSRRDTRMRKAEKRSQEQRQTPATSIPVRRNSAALAAMRRAGQG